MTYLIDTNICIYLMNSRSQSLINKFKSYSIGEIAISSVTVAELQYGISRSQRQEENQRRLNKFITPFSILSFQQNDTKAYGDLRAKLSQSGQIIGALDMMIAAQALANQLTLVTNNVKEFQRIDGLNIEDWTQ